jgi:uncharacterized protein
MFHNADQALIIFIRNPIPGKVKTRLAAETGNEKALEIYLKLLRHTRETAGQVNVIRYLYYSDFIDDHDEWDPSLFQKKIQKGNSLGEKMLHAFEDVLAVHSQAVIIGSDCYVLRADHIEQALEQLREKDMVIGPAEDGGYYLLGLKKPHPAIFDKVDWGTEKVMQQTLTNAAQHHVTYTCLELLYDVDTFEDWQRIGIQ